MTLTVFRYLILLSIHFDNFIFLFYSCVLVLIEKIYLTLKTVFVHISKHLEVDQKYYDSCSIFNSLLCVWKWSLLRLLYYFIFLQIKPIFDGKFARGLILVLRQTRTGTWNMPMNTVHINPVPSTLLITHWYSTYMQYIPS